MPSYILYYSTQKEIDICKEAYFLWKEQKQNPKYIDVVWVQDLQDDAQIMGKYFHGVLPVLKCMTTPYTEYFGNDAPAQMRILYNLPAATPAIPDLYPATGVVDSAPSALSNYTSQPSHHSGQSLPPGLPPSMAVPPPPPVTVVVQPPPLIGRVRSQYALYTTDEPENIKVPGNGLINVQDYDLIATTYGDKLPKWLQNPRALPILATLEKKPTIWYGVAAKHQCELLCLLNGGIMLS